MEKRFVYADNAATTPMSETAFNAMKPWLTENYGNPSSLYRIGRAAKEALNDARSVVGKCLNAAEPVNEKNDYAPGEIVFTGGGSQADNLAIRGFMHGPSSKGRKHIITSKIEHHAVLYTFSSGAETEIFLPVLSTVTLYPLCEMHAMEICAFKGFVNS